MDKNNKIKKLILIGNANSLHLQTWSNLLKNSKINHTVYSANLTKLLYPVPISCSTHAYDFISPVYYFRLAQIAKRFSLVNLHMPVFKSIFLFLMPPQSVWVNIWGSELLVLPYKYPFFRTLLKKSLLRSKGIIVPNKYTKEKTTELLGTSSIPIKIIPFPIDMNRFSPIQRSAHKYPTLILPKEIKHIYGTDILLKAWETIYKKYGGKLILTGKNPLPDKWRNIISDIPENATSFPGFVSNIENYYAQSDITIIPSRSESFGIVALESILMEIPVIASNIGGLKEIINETGGGILVKKESPEEIIKAVDIIWNNYNEWKIKMKKARNIVKEKYNNENIINKIKILWEKY